MAFEARYQSVCGECGERIHAGDRATYIDGAIAHDDCESTVVTPTRKADVCTKCWLTKPCGCEDPS